jgi:Na+-driven multidrug efflux pump
MIKNVERKWANRQRMAWYSFWTMIILTLILWFVVPEWYNYMNIDSKIWTENITSSAEWLYITLGSVILGYMGTSMMMFKNSLQSKYSEPSETDDQQNTDSTK